MLLVHLKSPARRVFAFVLIAFTSLTAYFIAQDYFSTLHTVRDLTVQRLHSLAKSISLDINGDEHAQMTHYHKNKNAIKNKNTDSIYAKIHAILKKNYEACQLKSPIYTVVYEESSQKFLFAVTSSDEPYYRHEYATPPQYLIENRIIGGTSDIYRDEFGHWLSAFEPIKNREGNVVALLQVDEKFDDFKAQLDKIVIKKIVLGIFIFIILTFVLLKFISTVLTREQELKKKLETAFLEKKELSESLAASEIQLQEYAQKLEQSNRELSDFANIASHDLKAPIRGILSFSQLLEKRCASKFDERDKEFFNFIKTNANQSLRLIENLLTYSKVDKNIGAPTEMNVAQAIETALTSLNNIIEERNCQVYIDEMPYIKAHHTLMSQLFQNLINNGIKYNQSPQPIIHIQVKQSDTEGYIFSVKDNGIGIPERFQQDIFAMFRRLHHAGEYEGSGIGLAFCKRIIETYEGRIWLDSTGGKGSIFYFTLPKAYQNEAVLT